MHERNSECYRSINLTILNMSFRRREHGAGRPQKAGWSPRAATPKDTYQTEPTAAAAATVNPWPVASKSADSGLR